MQPVKFALIGAGSTCFCPPTVTDILLSQAFAQADLTIHLMDLDPEALEASRLRAQGLADRLERRVSIQAATDLAEALRGAHFVIVAIEKERYHYWSQDFHVPRRYGFRQIYGENGGPGGMFHFLRNAGPILEVARAIEAHCPDAWMLNYTNPEAKLVEMVGRLTRVKVVGLCHGERQGLDQLALFLDMPVEQIDACACGLNHFGWYLTIRDRHTGEDLYPRLRERERQADWLADWDELALTRILFRTYGLWPYPGANHIGEYLAWGDGFLASSLVQYFHDPACERPWETRIPPEFVYCFRDNPTARPLFARPAEPTPPAETAVEDLRPSQEYGIPIAEAVWFDRPTEIGAVNVRNAGIVPNLLPGMAVEVPATVDGRGLHPHPMPPLPIPIATMINVQGAIHELLIQAFSERSRNKLLQALLLDPTVSSYAKAVALIDEMFRLQGDILPPLTW